MNNLFDITKKLTINPQLKIITVILSCNVSVHTELNGTNAEK